MIAAFYARLSGFPLHAFSSGIEMQAVPDLPHKTRRLSSTPTTNNKMSGAAGYDVVVDVDEEVSFSSARLKGLTC
jgi:hypothetical protein